MLEVIEVLAKLRLLCLLSIGSKNWGISSDFPQF